VHPETFFTRYLAEYFTHFYHTYISDALCDGDERVTVWGQKVEVQGHGGIMYAGTITAQAEAYNIDNSHSVQFSKNISIAQLSRMSHCAPEATLNPIRLLKFTPETVVSNVFVLYLLWLSVLQCQKFCWPMWDLFVE